VFYYRIVYMNENGGRYIMGYIMDKEKDISLLEELGIDVISTERNYWFIRTQKGTYYDDFINESFVAIEWDKISDKEFIEEATEEKMKIEVIKYYPDTDRPGYVVGQISRFANTIKKGDIVLIPSEKSNWISFGKIVDDGMFIFEEEEEQENTQTTIEEFYDQLPNEDKKPILKKRRNVQWIKHIKRTDLDPYLYGIVYAHNAVVDANSYSLYIDRTLSQFYIKGEEASFTYKVNKAKNIPFSDTMNLLNNNYQLINFINKYYPDYAVNAEELVLKINVQSKGPVQLKGIVGNVLIVGLVIGALFGTKMEFKVPILDYKLETAGLPGLIKTVDSVINDEHSDEKQKELQAIIDNFKKNKQRLQLQVPTVNQNVKELPTIKGK